MLNDRKMKLLVLADGLGPSDSRGIEIIFEILEALSRLGVDISLVSIKDHFITEERYEKWKQDKEKLGIKIYLLDFKWFTSKHLYLSIWLAKIPTFIKAIFLSRGQKFDIVHEYSSSPLLFLRTALLAFFSGTKSVHTVITYNDRFFARPFWSIFGNLLSKVVIPSNTFANKYRGFLSKNKINVLSQGVNCSRFISAKSNKKMYHLPDNKKVFLYLGPPAKHKGVFLLIDAIRQLLQNNESAFFVFVFHRKLSEEEYNNAILRIKQQLNEFGDNVLIIESLVDVPVLMKSVDCLILPQVEHHGTLIFPQTLLEGMISGRIVIAPKTPEISELVEDKRTGYLFRRGDVDSLVQAIESAMKADDGIGLAAQNVALEKHDINKIAEHLKQLYYQLVETK